MAPSTTTLRWLFVWITIAILVLIVVIGFLFGIASSLESIDHGLSEAKYSVGGANGDVRPLPAHLQDINANLTKVDGALKPLSNQANQIIAELGSIRSTLVLVDRSLGSTSGSLGNTSGSLVDTSGLLVGTSGSLRDTSGRLGDILGSLRSTSGSLGTTSGSLGKTSSTLTSAEGGLVSIRRLAGDIRARLNVAQIPGSLGTNAIWRNVRVLNGGAFNGPAKLPFGVGPINRDGLRFVQRDTGQITGGLIQVNRHLTSICNSPVVNGVGTITPIINPGGPGNGASPRC